MAQQAQWAAAAQAYEQAIGLRSDLGYFYSSLGDVLTQLGDSTRAAAAYANAKAADAGR